MCRKRRARQRQWVTRGPDRPDRTDRPDGTDGSHGVDHRDSPDRPDGEPVTRTTPGLRGECDTEVMRDDRDLQDWHEPRIRPRSDARQQLNN